MLAELRGKVNAENSNLDERREDELTGNFFGNMRYIPFRKGMKQILLNAVRPMELRTIIEAAHAECWSNNLFLWERIREANSGHIVELDVRLDFDDVVIGIEVKFNSGLSSHDETNEWQKNTASLSDNQLSKEARLLEQIAPGKKKLLLLLANENVCASTIGEVEYFPKDVQLGYLSWQEILIQLYKLTELNEFETVIVDDVIQLLEKKGFIRFTNFLVEMTVNVDEIWKFNLEHLGRAFKFIYKEAINKNQTWNF